MKKIALFSWVLGLALCSPHGAVLASTVPFFDNFETYAVGTPLLNGTNNGWYGSSSNVMVTNGSSVAGSTNMAMIPIECTLSNQFDGTLHTSVWLQVDTRLIRYEDQIPATPTLDTNAAVFFYVNSNGHFVVHDGPSILTNWVALTNTLTGEAVIPTTETNFVRLNIHQDFTAKTWDLFVNYVLVTNHIRFVNTNITTLNSLKCYNGNMATTYLDNVWFMTTNPPDLGPHGSNWLPVLAISTSVLTCAVLEGITATSQTYQVWKTYGYYDLWFTNTISGLSGGQNWLTLTPATNISTGDLKPVTVTYNTAGLPPGTYTGLITVAGNDTTFGFTASNSPQTLAVSMTVETNLPVLAVNPVTFEQSFQKGGNPTNQSFWIWNNSAAPVIPMAYSISNNAGLASWINLSVTNGTSAGEQDPVTLIFSDMSDFDSGTYTGRVTVRAWDVWPGYMPTGAVVQTAELAVAVEIVVPPAPSQIWASKGSDTSKVIVHWNMTAATGVLAAASYELFRYTTFDSDYASQIADMATTNYEDTSTAPGVLYYYWVRAVNTYGVRGNMSGYDSGYRALSSPEGVQATDGAYTNKVAVTWSSANGAASYEVYRSLYGDSGTGSLVYHSDELSFNDLQVAEGVKYWYQVKTVRGPYASALSTGDVGYVLSKPTGVSASKGTYTSRVRVSWNAADGATEYEVWRNSVALSQSAAKAGYSSSSEYDDTLATPGTLYYYWVKAKSATATSAFSGSDSGYAATGAADVAIWSLVTLPAVMPPGSHPAILSFRMRNNGPSALASPNTAMGLNFYMGQTTDINQAVSVGSVKQDVTLAAGMDAVVTVNGLSGVTMPAVTGAYYVFVQTAPVWPNLLADESQGDNITMRAGVIHVTGSGSPHYLGINDYDGDGISDLAVVDASQGTWSVQTADGRVLGENVPFGGATFTPAVGDYDGDRKADPAIYDAGSGLWSVMLSGSGYATASAMLGGPGYMAVPGDYDGDGKADPVVYQASSGYWVGFLSASGYAQASGQFGAAGYRPVPGDYDGDGLWDLALYHEATGYWFIRTPGGELLKWGEYWGAAGYPAVSGDYDGDGVWDLAVYSENTGHWYIRTMSGTVLAAGTYWGSPAYAAVPGDYDGDGVWDLAVYHTANGRWYARSVSGRIILFNSLWGSSAATPVKWQ